MRALTIHQPHASLLATGLKVIETRTWTNPYRGILLIHAGKTFDENAEALPVDSSVRGAIIGYCYLFAIIQFQDFAHFKHYKMEHMCKPVEDYWQPGLFGWRMKAAYKLPEPIPARGWPKLWTPRPELIEKVKLQMRKVDVCPI